MKYLEKMGSRGYIDDVTIIIPTLNEEKAIGKVIGEILAEGFKKKQIIVIDGHSTDKTREIAESMGVKVILQDGKGKANAVYTGLKHARTKYVVVIDGDYTYPAKYIPLLIEKAVKEDYDEVIGARVYGRENIPLINRVGNYFLTKMFNLMFNTSLRDVLSGLYLVKKESLSNALFEMRGFSVESEIATHIVTSGGRIGEVPIEYRSRIGKKKLKILHGFHIALDIIRLTWRYNPAIFILLLALALLIPGAILGIYTGYHYFFTGVKYYVKGLIAMILLATGFNLLILSIIAIYLKRMELRLTRQLRREREA